MSDWPRCVICYRELTQAERARYACRMCERGIGAELTALPGLYEQLGEHLAPSGPAVGEYVRGGSVEAPLPVSEDVLSLTSAGGIVTILASWEADWRETLGWDPSPAARLSHALPGIVNFLHTNLLWACGEHSAIDEFAAEVHQLHRAAARIVDPVEAPTVVGRCPRADDDLGRPCGGRLELPPGGQTVRCSHCNTGWGQLQWLDLLRRLEAPESAEQTAA